MLPGGNGTERVVASGPEMQDAHDKRAPINNFQGLPQGFEHKHVLEAPLVHYFWQDLATVGEAIFIKVLEDSHHVLSHAKIL